MDERQRAFLERLLDTASPSGYETAGQRVWVDHVREFADEVRTNAYGNAVAVHDGGGPELAIAGHADEIGLVVREITDEGSSGWRRSAARTPRFRRASTSPSTPTSRWRGSWGRRRSTSGTRARTGSTT